MSDLVWRKQAPGIWCTKIGDIDDFNPISIVDATPRIKSLKQMKDIPFPFKKDDIVIEKDRRRLIISIPLTEDEKIYGFGLQFMRINHRGRTRYLRVNSDPKQDTGETHAPIPFYVSSQGYGLLVNTSRIVRFYCGSCVRKDNKVGSVVRNRNDDPLWCATPISDSMEIIIEDEGIELYVFSGETMLDVVKRYNLYCGGGTLPPKWGLGFWHRVPTKYTSKQVMEEALEYRKRDFPCDVIGLEPGWHSSSYPVTYEWNNELYPDPDKFIEGMTKKGFKLNLWEHPYVSPKASIYEELQPLSGSHTVWGGLVPDYSLDKARRIYKDQHEKEHVNRGISGYKLDECDGSELTNNSWIFPEHATFPSGHDGEQMRQVYGLIMQKITAEIFKEKGLRTYGLIRASTAASVSFPYVLYSDLYDHRQFVRALCNASFSGLLWTPEVREGKNAEDFVRRMQVVCFSPLAMLNGWSHNTKPWSFPEVEHIIRKYIKLRVRLLPYFYSAFARYYFEGIPPFRAMQLYDEFDDINFKNSVYEDAYGKYSGKEIGDQYMAGDSLLVAPLFEGESKRNVYLPKGVWYDFETGEKYEGGKIIKVNPGLEKIPIFVKSGGIIPLMSNMSYTAEIAQNIPLEIRHYGMEPGEFRLYDDDGYTLDYEKGVYSWIDIKVEINSEGVPKGEIIRVSEQWKSSYGDITWNFIK